MRTAKKWVATLLAFSILCLPVGTMAADAASIDELVIELSQGEVSVVKNAKAFKPYVLQSEKGIKLSRSAKSKKIVLSFTDSKGKTRNIAMSKNAAITIDGTGGTVTLNPSLGNVSTQVAQSASVSKLVVKNSGEVQIAGKIADVNVVAKNANVNVEKSAAVNRISVPKGVVVMGEGAANVGQTVVKEENKPAPTAPPYLGGGNIIWQPNPPAPYPTQTPAVSVTGIVVKSFLQQSGSPDPTDDSAYKVVQPEKGYTWKFAAPTAQGDKLRYSMEFALTNVANNTPFVLSMQKPGAAQFATVATPSVITGGKLKVFGVCVDSDLPGDYNFKLVVGGTTANATIQVGNQGVAQVGSKMYSTLQEAIDVAHSGADKVVTVVKDIPNGASIVIPAGVRVQGKTPATTIGFGVTLANTATLKDITVAIATDTVGTDAAGDLVGIRVANNPGDATPMGIATLDGVTLNITAPTAKNTIGVKIGAEGATIKNTAIAVTGSSAYNHGIYTDGVTTLDTVTLTIDVTAKVAGVAITQTVAADVQTNLKLQGENQWNVAAAPSYGTDTFTDGAQKVYVRLGTGVIDANGSIAQAIAKTLPADGIVYDGNVSKAWTTGTTQTEVSINTVTP